MLSRDSVRDSCSVRLWESIFSVMDVVAASEDVDAPVSSGREGFWEWRERREGGKSWSRSEGAGSDGGAGSRFVGGGWVSSIAGSDCVSFPSTSSEGVSSPSRSSPSDVSSSVSFSNYGSQ
jgi:hypothetical protein